MKFVTLGNLSCMFRMLSFVITFGKYFVGISLLDGFFVISCTYVSLSVMRWETGSRINILKCRVSQLGSHFPIGVKG